MLDESAVLARLMRIMAGWLRQLRISERSDFKPGCVLSVFARLIHSQKSRPRLRLDVTRVFTPECGSPIATRRGLPTHNGHFRGVSV